MKLICRIIGHRWRWASVVSDVVVSHQRQCRRCGKRDVMLTCRLRGGRVVWATTGGANG